MLTTEQQTAIVEKAKEHARKNVGLLKATFPGVILTPTDGRTAKIAIPTPDGGYLSVFRGKDMFLDDRSTLEFVASSERVWNEAEATVLRYKALDEVLLEAA